MCFPSTTLKDYLVVPIKSMMFETIRDAFKTSEVVSGWVEIIESNLPNTLVRARIEKTCESGD